MEQKKIEHPLRTIVLDYDEAKPITDYEKQLVAAYVTLHDKAVPLQKQKAKLTYEYGILTDQVADATKAFAPIVEAIDNMFEEAHVATTQLKSEAAIAELQERMGGFSEGPLHDFHNGILTPLADLCEGLQTEFETYQEQVEKLGEEFETYHSDTCNELYKNYDNYSLDLCAYDMDEQEFRGVLDDLNSFEDVHEKIIEQYNNLMGTIRDSYDQWEIIKEKFTKFYDNDNLFDRSLSDSFTKKDAPLQNSPSYLIPPGDKRISDFKRNYGLLASSNSNTLIMSVPKEVVRAGDAYSLQEIIMLLQHYPKMIEKWIFAINISFIDELGNTMSEDEWKGHRVPMQWFVKLNSLPCVIFFIQDRDARHYMLMADIIPGENVEMVEGKKEQAIMIDGTVMQQIQERLFNCCRTFMLYCHNTGFDPEPYIEALMAEFEALFTYKDLQEQFEDDIAAGVKLQAIPMKDGKPLKE